MRRCRSAVLGQSKSREETRIVDFFSRIGFDMPVIFKVWSLKSGAERESERQGFRPAKSSALCEYSFSQGTQVQRAVEEEELASLLRKFW